MFLYSCNIKIKPRLSNNIKKKPNCKNCKHSFMESGGKLVCSLFTFNNSTINYYIYAEQCRSIEKLCGQDGFYYSPIID